MVVHLHGDVQAVAVAVRVPDVAAQLVDEVQRGLGDVEPVGLQEGDLRRDGVVPVAGAGLVALGDVEAVQLQLADGLRLRRVGVCI